MRADEQTDRQTIITHHNTSQPYQGEVIILLPTISADRVISFPGFSVENVGRLSNGSVLGYEVCVSYSDVVLGLGCP